MIPPEACFVVFRYGVSWACIWLASRGYVAAGIPDEVVTAAAQIIFGLLGAVGMLLWGLWRDRQKVIDAVRAVAHMRGIRGIHADPAIAATLKAEGVPNVVATPLAQP